ncbi:MAG: molybdopterin-containing oxidoreductase family protein [Desulfitobacteriaceae bacterium]
MTVIRSACPLNCPDSCAFLVERTENGLRVRGDQDNPITRGFVCSKGQALAKRVFSPDRLRFPLLRQGIGFRRIAWEEAYERLSQEIRATLNEVGSWGILHHYDYGHNGVLRALDRRFFQALGGVTEPRGSMCWGAGFRAQELDFGGVYSSAWQDLYNASTIILWGRDPAVTNLHLVPILLEAKKRGAHVLVINPVKVKSADFADEYLRVHPGTDAALALGISHIILSEGWLDWDFVRAHVHGFDEYAFRAKGFPPEKVEEITGVNQDNLRRLAHRISHARPASFILGYGLQRYTNGGNTVRAIDALAAISGNIGRPGAGVHYAHQYHRDRLKSVLLPSESYQSRAFPHPQLARSLDKADPPVRLAFVTRSNPLVQQPDSLLWREVWQKIPFKVVCDTVLTETARQADLVLPVTTVFEEEELIATSWSPLLQYSQRVLEPQGEAKSEPILFTELAQRLGLENSFSFTVREWLEYVLEPLRDEGITLARLKQGPVWAPYIPEVAWENREFLTPSGKIELSSGAAQEELGDAIANYIPSQNTLDAREYPFYLLTPHPLKGLHSQFQEEEGFRAYIHPSLAEKHYLLPGNRVVVETTRGQLIATVLLSEDIHPAAVVIPEGTTEDGLGVNQLIPGLISDCGENTAYYDVRCALRKWIE